MANVLEEVTGTLWQAEVRPGVPQQENADDCGVFCTMFAEFATTPDAALPFSQKDARAQRKKIAQVLTGAEVDEGQFLSPKKKLAGQMDLRASFAMRPTVQTRAQKSAANQPATEAQLSRRMGYSCLQFRKFLECALKIWQNSESVDMFLHFLRSVAKFRQKLNLKMPNIYGEKL